jgi:2,3-bisphosphoglycerate-independent phosphoglycerate mutase
MHIIHPIVLIILDGWGFTDASEYNAIAKAHTPQWDEWMTHYPHCLLDASGPSVGLPEGQIGNSEVGHMHIGAGQRILQDFYQINLDIQSQTFFEKDVLIHLCQDTVQRNVTLHVMGLLSSGGIHSHEKHLYAFLEIAARHGRPKIALDLFLDGRDVAPKCALETLDRLEQQLQNYSFAHINTLSGRFYGMDRDHRWERVEKTYNTLTLRNQTHFSTAREAILHNYANNVTDEFILPCQISENFTPIQNDDNVFFFNFRADRAIQLTECLISSDFKGFERQQWPHLHHMVTMTKYAEHLKTRIVYPPHHLKNTLGEVLEHHRLHQLRIAETEKFPHVTFFLNGGRETPFENEERILIASPRVQTYDLMPQMRAFEITEAIIEGLASQKYEVIIANFANADMVGHCGELPATIEAIETLDQCFQKINNALVKYQATAIITADHGNAEVMFNEETQQKHTAHTLSPVPFLCVGKNCQMTKSHGSLIDIAPTILYLLDIPQPKEMTGERLLEKL